MTDHPSFSDPQRPVLDPHNAGDGIRAASLIRARLLEGERFLHEVQLIVAEYDCSQIVTSVVDLFISTMGAVMGDDFDRELIADTLDQAVQGMAGDDVGREGALWADDEGVPS